MSGHSKWSQIKRKKGITDQKRGLVFSKISRIITLSVKEGGGIGDPEKNVKLRLAVSQAKASNMPKDNIDRAIEKGKGTGAANLKEIVYEGFGPSGVSLLIIATTDNSNRSHAEVKHALEKHGGKIGSINSVAHNFQKCGLVIVGKSHASEDEVFEFCDAIGFLDMVEVDDAYFIYIPFEKLGKAHEILGEIHAESVEIFYRPLISVPLDETGHAKVESLLEILEDLEDVDKVYTNYA